MQAFPSAPASCMLVGFGVVEPKRRGQLYSGAESLALSCYFNPRLLLWTSLDVQIVTLLVGPVCKVSPAQPALQIKKIEERPRP